LHLFKSTDGSTTVDNKVAQINVHLEEQTIIEFLVAEDEKVTCIQKYMLNVYMEVTLDVSSF
jgi:hypothetical protein